MELKRLEKLGINRNEARIYLALLEIGEGLAGEISKKTKINRTTTYDSIKRLQEKGLVTFTVAANRKLFKPVAPSFLKKQVKEKEKIVKEILPSLNDLYKNKKSTETAVIYKGKKGINSIFAEILEYKSFIAYGSFNYCYSLLKSEFNLFQKNLRELNIKSSIIQNGSEKKAFRIKSFYFSYVKFLSLDIPNTVIVYDDNTVNISWGDEPVASLITSKKIARSHREYFNELWKNAKT